MSTQRPFTASTNKFAYAQAFSRSSTSHPAGPSRQRVALRSLAGRLHRSHGSAR